MHFSPMMCLAWRNPQKGAALCRLLRFLQQGKKHAVVKIILAVLVAKAKVTSKAVAFSIPGKPVDARQREWHDYTANQAGRWRGLWTTYDPSGNQQGDPDRMDTTLDLSSNGQVMKHVNTLYVESVDSDCSSCFDSVETREMPVGEYTQESFRQRVSGAVYLSGPGVTRRGDMTTEVGFRCADRRVRCVVSHRPVFNGAEPPSQLLLERIVIVKETRSAREDSVQTVDSLWSRFEKPSWLGLWYGHTRFLDAVDTDGGNGEGGLAWQEEPFPPSHLRKCRCSGVPEEDSHLSLEVDGGIRLEAPKLVRSGEPAELSVSWSVGRTEAGESCRIMQTKVRLEALSRIVGEEGGVGDAQNVRISPPKLLRFDVGDLEPVESAGLR